MKKNSCRNFIILFLLLPVLHSASAQVVVYDTFEELNREILTDVSPDTIFVINFWATWCGPCVKELPYFEQLNEKYENTAFKQILVSLDAPKKLENKVIPFIKERAIKSEVVLLADGRYNSWIDRVDPSWSGAIPITLFLKGNKKLFYEKEFHSMEELEIELLKLL